MTDRKTIREVVVDLLRENAALRQILRAMRPTVSLPRDAVDAARDLLCELDSLDVRITERLAEDLPPKPENGT